MQYRGPFVDADRRLAAIAAHPSARPSARPSAQPLPLTTAAVRPTTRTRPAPGRLPTAVGAPDRAAMGRAAPVPVVAPLAQHAPAEHRSSAAPTDPEDGSLVTECGLLAVVAATVAGVVIQWASGGALVTLFNALLRHARSLVGA